MMMMMMMMIHYCLLYCVFNHYFNVCDIQSSQTC